MSAHASPVLSLSDIEVRYGSSLAVGGVRLDIQHGETFGLIGLNGAGKTSLIKAMLGLRDPDAGTVKIDGLSASDMKSRLKTTYLPERFDPPWFLKGFEFLKFSQSLYKKGLDKAKAIEMAESLALDPAALGRKVQTYSKGMRQKLGLMSVFLTECPLTVLDEPMSGLDPQARKLVKNLILRAKQADRTMFLSTHILADMNEICDRVGVIHNRSLCFLGSPDDLKREGGSEDVETAFLNVIQSAPV